jgi:hypothetical protein
VRYGRILNPRMIFWYDGVATYGRDAIMATARATSRCRTAIDNVHLMPPA